MLSHEERVSEVKRRIAANERAKRLQRGRMTAAAAAVACLALIVGCSFAIPNITAKLRLGDDPRFETAASIFNSSAALGYIVIGLLAFLLGVCMTILCFRLRQMNREDAQDKESEERHGAD